MPRVCGDERAQITDFPELTRSAPHYAGMKGLLGRDSISVTSLPRATRGWKGRPGRQSVLGSVCPAYGGDERAETASPIQATMSAPRYAGMKEASSNRSIESASVPRATRG